MKTWIKIVLLLVLAGVLAIFLVYKFVYNKKHPDFENLEPVYTLSSQFLYQEFKTNKETATAKYNGKMIAITGKLSKVEKADSLVTAVFVFEQGDFGDQGIRCTVLSKFNDAAERLQPDGDVKIKGYCTGYNETDVVFEKCSIINQ